MLATNHTIENNSATGGGVTIRLTVDSGAGTKPDATNTGVVDEGALVASTSKITTTSDGQVIEDREITDSTCIHVKHDNVTIRNCRLYFRGFAAIRVDSDKTGILIEDVEVRGERDGEGVLQYSGNGLYQNYGIYGRGFTARRVHVTDVGQDAFHIYSSNVVIEDCYVHDIGKRSGAHGDAIQLKAGSGHIIRRNNLDVPMRDGHNAALLIQSEGGGGVITGVSVTENWMNGGNYTTQCRDSGAGADPTNVAYTNNRFGRDYRYGVKYIANEGITTWTGNVYDDTGEEIEL